MSDAVFVNFMIELVAVGMKTHIISIKCLML